MSDDYSANVQTTGAVAVGGSATGVIETAYDQDWFAVELEAGRTYQFDLGGSPSGGGTLSDTFLRAIYDSEGRYQSDSYNDDFGGSRDSRVTFTASQSGTYYVRASGDRDETGSYTLRVSDVTPGPVEDPPPVEPPAETVASEEPARAAAEDLGDITELAAPRFPLGTLDGGGDTVAWYRFTLSEAREVALGLRRQDADADLVLEDAAGNVLHSSERSGTTNEWLRETLLAGTYYVRVEAQEAGANAYVFRYGVGDADPAEVTRLEAEQESVQEQVQQQPPAFGSQFYGFDLPENTDGSANRISLGTVSAVDPEGDTLTYSIEGGNAAGLFEIDAASGELFYTGGGEDYETGSTSFELTVRASDGDQTTDTTATVNVTDVDEPVEGNPPVAQPDQSTPQTVSEPSGEDFSAGASTSGRVAVGDTATGNIGSNGDRDWFAVELVAGRTYVIDLRGSRTDDGTLSDPYLGGIHDSDGNLIPRTTNDDGGQGYNSRVTFTATESGTHYIAAGAAGVFSGQGTYEVEVTDTSPPIVAPDPDSEEPPDPQEQVQQQPPAFGSQFYGFELPENTDGSADRISLGTVSATDPDGGSVTYSIEGGNAAGLFEIDAASGELFYTGGGEDYETGSTSFELTVRASDGGSDDRHHRDRQRHRRGGSTGVWAGGLRLRSGGERGRQHEPDITGHGLGNGSGRRVGDLQHRGRQRGGAVRDRCGQRRAVLHGRGRGLRDRFDQLRADCPGERRGSDDRHHRDRQRHRRGGSTGVWAGGLRLRSGGEHGRQREPDIAGHGLGDGSGRRVGDL